MNRTLNISKKQQETKQFNKEAMRCCCALADIENATNNNGEDSLMKSILVKIANVRGIKRNEIDGIIKELKRTEPTVNNACKPTLLKARIIRVLYNMVRIILADHREKHEEKLLFHFVCIKMNILNASDRQRIYTILKKFAEINLSYTTAVDDFVKDISDEISKNMNSVSTSFQSNLKNALLGHAWGDDIYKACTQCLNKEMMNLSKDIHDNKSNQEIETIQTNFYKQINKFLSYKRFRKRDFYHSITDERSRSSFTEDDDFKYSITEIEQKLIYTEKDTTNGEIDSQKELLRTLLIQLECKEECVDIVCRDSELCECIDESRIDIKSLNSSDSYSTAIINLEQERSDKTYEFSKLRQINRDLSRLDEFLLSRYFQTTKTPKDIAQLFFDFYCVIIADNDITIDEKILLKIFSHIYDISASQYQFIFSELNKIYNEALDTTYKLGGNRKEFIDNFWKKRKRAVKNITRELENSCHIKAEKSFRFALVCSLAYVDGKMEDIEKTILYDIGIRDYNLSISEIEKIFMQFDDSQGKADKLHVELLCNIPIDSRERKKDLDNCKRVISADGTVTDAERCAFKMVCLFYGVKDWEKVCLSERIATRYRRPEDNKGRVLFSKSNYEEIKEVLDKGVINEPLKSGIKSALVKRHAEQKRSKTRGRRAATLYAFSLFIISAIVLYSYATYVVHSSFKLVPDANSTIHTTIPTSTNTIKETNVIFTEYTPIKLIIAKSKSCESMITGQKKNDESHLSLIILSIIILFLVGVVLIAKKKDWFKLVRRSLFMHPKSIMSLMIIIISLCIPLKYYLSMLILIMMLAIEWLILMRETKENHQSKLLALLVFMAIATDLSFGMIELEQSYDIYGNVLDKVFSALFTGCICFFTGKFMELTYSHSIEDEKAQEDIIKKITNKY